MDQTLKELESQDLAMAGAALDHRAFLQHDPPMAAHSLKSPHYPPAPALQQLTRLIDGGRVQYSKAHRERIAGSYEQLRTRFQELSLRTKDVCQDPRLKDVRAALLQRLAGQTSSVSKSIDFEFSRIDAAADPIAPVELLERLIEFNELQLQRLCRRLRSIDRMVENADDLHEAVQELLYSRSTSAYRLQNLAQGIILDAREAATAEHILPAPGLSIDEFLPAYRRPLEPVVYFTGISTAQFVACALRQQAEWDDRLELLTIGALLQDVGYLVLDRTRYDSDRPTHLHPNPRADEQHPTAGAALSAGIDSYSVDLPFLAAGHHERADGTGFPNGLLSQNMSRSAQCLAVVVRMAELVRQVSETLDSPSDNDELPDLREAYMPAAAKLLREAQQGGFNREMVSGVLEGIEFDAKQVKDSIAHGWVDRSQSLTARKARQDAAHGLRQKPHTADFETIRSTRARRLRNSRRTTQSDRGTTETRNFIDR